MSGGIVSKNNPRTTRVMSPVIGFSPVIRQISCGMAALIAARPFPILQNYSQTVVSCTAGNTAIAAIELPSRMIFLLRSANCICIKDDLPEGQAQAIHPLIIVGELLPPVSFIRLSYLATRPRHDYPTLLPPTQQRHLQ